MLNKCGKYKCGYSKNIKPSKCNHKKNCVCKKDCGYKHKQECCGMEVVYMFLGKYVYDLLKCVELPCGHPDIKESLICLAMGKPLPCGHPTLEEILKMIICEEECECICECKCKCYEYGKCNHGSHGKCDCGCKDYR